MAVVAMGVARIQVFVTAIPWSPADLPLIQSLRACVRVPGPPSLVKGFPLSFSSFSVASPRLLRHTTSSPRRLGSRLGAEFTPSQRLCPAVGGSRGSDEEASGEATEKDEKDKGKPFTRRVAPAHAHRRGDSGSEEGQPETRMAVTNTWMRANAHRNDSHRSHLLDQTRLNTVAHGPPPETNRHTVTRSVRRPPSVFPGREAMPHTPRATASGESAARSVLTSGPPSTESAPRGPSRRDDRRHTGGSRQHRSR